MLRIDLEDLQQPDWQPLYVGDRARYATATSVRFVDAHTIVCCSLLGRVMYLIRFDVDTGQHEVLDRVGTTYGGLSMETDLCDVDGRGNVVTSNCEAGGLSLYRLVNAKIIYERDLPLGLPGNYCHGARFWGPRVVAATMLREPRGVHFYDIHTMRELLFVATERLPKDVCFLPDGRAAVITTDGAPELTRVTGRRTSEIVLVEIDVPRGRHAVVGRQVYDAGQLDSVTAHENRLYAVDSYGGRILVVDAGTLRQIDQIDGLDFPHGIDVNFGMMAVACYGTNAIHVRPLCL